MNRHVAAIDGPAGSGKSTVARWVARSLGWLFLDTGAMYRALTWHLLRIGVDLEAPGPLDRLLNGVALALDREGKVIVDGRRLGPAELQDPDVEARVARVAGWGPVRAFLREKQRSTAGLGPLVAEGRDMGSVVFPDAAWKFFLEASLECRARRRYQELSGRGVKVTLAGIQEVMAARDRADLERADGPLVCAPDALRIQTDALSPEDVALKILERIGSEPEAEA